MMRLRKAECFGGKSWRWAMIWLALCLHLGISGCQVWAAECSSADQTSITTYNPEEEICCAGVVHRIRVDIQQGCCGQEFFNSAVQDCCDGQALDRDSNLKCCSPAFGSFGSERVYDSDSQICCQGTLAPKTADAVCCGPVAMDGARQTCCDDGHLGLSPRDGRGRCCGPDKVYDPSREICCESAGAGPGHRRQSRVHLVGEDVVADGEAVCCGLAPINTTEQHCCAQVPNDKTASSQCCGQTTYDRRTQVCCRDSVRPLVDGRTSCCSSTPYNPDNQVCCFFGTAVYQIGHGRCCGGSPYSPVLASCCGRTGLQPVPEETGVQGCCNGNAYPKTDHLCCQGNLTARQPNRDCCGKRAYDTENQLCCQGKIFARATDSQQCCGSTSYDASTQTCCPRTGQVFQEQGLSCCYAGTGTETLAYDPGNQTCCAGKLNVSVYAETLATDRCCGPSLLQTNQLCDRFRQQPIDKGRPNHNAVCRRTSARTGRPMRGSLPRTYNRDREVCSTAGDLWTRLDGEELCGQRRFRPDSQLCCAGQVYGMRDQYGNRRHCCHSGVHAYAPRLQSCFAGKVFNIPMRVAGVCRQRVYNVNTSACDRHGAVRPRDEVERLPSLCGVGRGESLAYHPASHRCCGNSLIGAGQTCCLGAPYETPGTAVGAGGCCGPAGGFNPDTHLCCRDKLYPKNGTDLECCGRRSFHTTDGSQICCDGRLYSTADGRTLCSDGTVHSPQETVCGGVRYDAAHGQCCGQNLLNDSEICCQGFVYSREEHGTECCGRVAFDPSSDQRPACCDGTLHRSAAGLQCCGSQLIDPARRQCCGAPGGRFAFARGSGGQTCCGQAAGDYDPQQHTCCRGLLHKYLVGGECCGPDAIRDPSKEMCCGGVVQDKRFGPKSVCCRGYVQDGRRISCCGNVALPRWSPRQRRCCNGVVFDLGLQECVGGEVKEKEVEGTTVGVQTLWTRHTQRTPRDVTHTSEGATELMTGEFEDGPADEATEQMTAEFDNQTYDGPTEQMTAEPNNQTNDNTNELMTAEFGRQDIDEATEQMRAEPNNQTNDNTNELVTAEFGRQDIDAVTEEMTADPNDQANDKANELVTGEFGRQDIDEDTEEMTAEPNDQANDDANELVTGEFGRQDIDEDTEEMTAEPNDQANDDADELVTGEFGRQDIGEATEQMAAEPNNDTGSVRSVTSSSPATASGSSETPCSDSLAREGTAGEWRCCGSLPYYPQNATCCQGAVTVGVANGSCCGWLTYDRSTAICCNKEVFRKAWLTPDMTSGCCPSGQSWNRMTEECEPSPTYDSQMFLDSSGMPPLDD